MCTWISTCTLITFCEILFRLIDTLVFVCSLLHQLAELHPCTALGERADPAERYVTVSTHAWSATDRQAAQFC